MSNIEEITVKELIEMLKKMPQDAIVYSFCEHRTDEGDIEDVYCYFTHVGLDEHGEVVLF